MKWNREVGKVGHPAVFHRRNAESLLHWCVAFRVGYDASCLDLFIEFQSASEFGMSCQADNEFVPPPPDHLHFNNALISI